MKVLVTGAAGFIGSNLVAELVRREHQVVGFDNLSQSPRLNLDAVANSPTFEFHEADIRDAAALASAADGCDVIVHLAAYKIPRYGDAYETLMINGFGSELVAQTASQTGAKIVAASTSDVYGKNPQVPFSEDMDSVIGEPQIKRWAYAISKMFEEQLLLACHERFGVDVVLLRFFGGYGPNQNLTWWGGPQAVFIEKALDREPLPIHGDGVRRGRSHTSPITSPESWPPWSSPLPTISSSISARPRKSPSGGSRSSIWQLVHGDDSEPEIEHIPYASFGKYEDVMRRVPDISRARELLGFEPQVDLRRGLAKTIEWQIERRRLIPS